MTKMAKVNREAIQKAVESTNDFLRWRTEIGSLDLDKKGLETRMRFVVAAIEMGITIQTALLLCHVAPEDFKSWKSIKKNLEILNRANAGAEAQLEYIIHQYARIAPDFALQVLMKRNSKRWDNGTGGAVPIDIPVKKLSETILDNPVQEEDAFDVEA